MTIQIKQVDREALLMAVSDLDNLEQARKVADIVAAQNGDFDIADSVDASLWMAARNSAALALATQRSTYEARIAELERERDEDRANFRDRLANHLVEAAVGEARLAEAVEVIRPFAVAGEVKLCGDWKDEARFGQTDVSFYLNFGHIRRAARFIQETERG